MPTSERMGANPATAKRTIECGCAAWLRHNGIVTIGTCSLHTLPGKWGTKCLMNIKLDVCRQPRPAHWDESWDDTILFKS